MGSRGQIPPHLHRPLPDRGILLKPDPFGSGSRLLPDSLPFDIGPLENVEQKLGVQEKDVQTLLIENHRLAVTHSTLKKALVAAREDLHSLQTHIGAIKAEQEQEMRVILDKMAKMEADLKVSERIKPELQQAHDEAQHLISVRHELISRVQQLEKDLHRSRGDAQIIPHLMSELESLREEYQSCRATNDYESKLRTDYSEQLQVMERNYVSMVREVEALRAKLSKSSYIDGNGHATEENRFEKSYGVSQAHEPYGSEQTQAPSGYVAAQAPHGPVQTQASAGHAQTQAPYEYEQSQALMYGSAQIQAPIYGSEQTQAPYRYEQSQTVMYGAAQPCGYPENQVP